MNHKAYIGRTLDVGSTGTNFAVNESMGVESISVLLKLVPILVIIYMDTF